MKLNQGSFLFCVLQGIFCVTICTSPVKAADSVREEIHKSFPLTSEGRVSLENINGNVRIESWDKLEVQVDAVKHGETREQVDAVNIVIDSNADRVSIKTKYQKPAGNSKSWRNSAHVDYQIKVPAKARLRDIATVNGNVELSDLSGQIKASTANGRLTAKSFAGEAHLESVNGTVKADCRALSGPVTVKTVNGSLDLNLPSNSNADLSAQTVNGRIRTSGLNVATRSGRSSHLKAKVGNGSTPVRLEAVNGNIDVHLSN